MESAHMLHLQVFGLMHALSVGGFPDWLQRVHVYLSHKCTPAERLPWLIMKGTCMLQPHMRPPQLAREDFIKGEFMPQ